MPKEERKVCFVLAPIGDADSETRQRSDQILKHIIRPIAEECGYEAVRADEIDEPGMITAQVIQHVVDDPMVVADLTDSNPNVFYELALRHALSKPAVHIIEAGQKIPFDVAGSRTVKVDYRNLDSVESCKQELVNQMKAVEQDPTLVDNPISVSLDLQLLRRSDNPLEKSSAEIIAMLQEIRSDVSDIPRSRAALPQSFIADLADITALLKNSLSAIAGSLPEGSTAMPMVQSTLDLVDSRLSDASNYLTTRYGSRSRDRIAELRIRDRITELRRERARPAEEAEEEE